MPRVTYSKPKPANAPRSVLAPRNGPQQAPLPSRAKAHIPTKAPRSQSTANRISKAPRVATKAPRVATKAPRVATKAPRDMNLHLQLRSTNIQQGGTAKYNGMVKIPPARRNPGRKARKDTREPEPEVTESEEDGILPAFYQPCHESDEDISEDSEHNMEDADQGLNLDQYTPSVYSDYDPMDEVTMLPGRVHFVREREAFRVKTAWKTCRIAKRVWRKLIKKAEEGGRTDERDDVFWIGQKIETWEERINRLADERWQAEFWWRWGYVDDVVQA